MVKNILQRATRGAKVLARCRRWSPTVEDYYPIYPAPRWGHGLSSHQRIKEILSERLPSFSLLLNDLQNYRSYFDGVPFEETSRTEPYWNNIWFSTLDAAALTYFIFSYKPKTYIEVGSGFS